MIPTVKVSGGWETVVEGPAREELERAVLPEYLRGQRWFGGKGRRIDSVRFLDWGGLAPDERRFFATLLEVRFVDGNSELYFLPLGVSSGDRAAGMMQSQQTWLIARLTGPEGEAFLHDALADEDTCLSLIETIGAQRELAMQHGRIRAFPTTEYSSLIEGRIRTMPVTRAPAKSSNSLIFYGQRLMLKLFRRLECGINPEFEIGRFLTERHLFQRIPRVGGAIEYQVNVAESRSDSECTSGASAPHSEPITLAILQSFVPNEGDGWQHAMDQFGRYYRRASSSETIAPEHRTLLELAELSPPSSAVELIGGFMDSARVLGRRTAEMHQALSIDASNPDFAPEPFTPHDASILQDSIRARAESALAALHDNLDQLPRDVVPVARQLLEKSPEIMRHLGSDPSVHSGAVKIRCHGDYHLGQVLRVQDDYVLIDFEGEPMRTVAERRAKQSPLKDVAGMLRSYHTAAYAGLFSFTQNQPEAFARLRPWAELWFQWVSAAFLREYRAGARGHSFVPNDAPAFAELLDAFMLEKNFYELLYELNNRPDWVRIPVRGILNYLESVSH